MTDNKKRLEGFLVNEILKSGFPLEIEVSSILENQQWIVLNNQPFRDPDEDELRSVDIVSFRSPSTYEQPKNLPFGFSPTLIIECKRTPSHAWVFFTRPQITKAFPMDGHVYNFPGAFSTKAFKERNQLEKSGLFSYEYFFNYYADPSEGVKHIHYFSFDRVAIAYKEYRISEFVITDKEKTELENKKGSKNRIDRGAGRNDILEAINQLVKFQNFDMNESIMSPGRIRGATSPFFPVELSFLSIVIDGKLFEAAVDQAKITLEERKHQVYRPRGSFSNLNFWIDVVTKEYFPEYLSIVTRDISMMLSKVVSKQSLLTKYLLKDVFKGSFG